MASSPAPVLPPAAPADAPATGFGRAFELTAKLATSWVGLLTAYAGAVTAAVFAVIKLKESFGGTRLWLWVTLAGLPIVIAFVFQTIPAISARRRQKWLISFDQPPLPGYFSLAPRENEETFKRADGKHEEVLRWLERRPAPVLYLTGLSGTGKSSLLSAWALPKLERSGVRVVCLRGYQDPIVTLESQLRTPGVIWDRRSPDVANIRSLLERACAYLRPRRLLIVIDQFEEFVILQDRARQESLGQLLNSLQQQPIAELTVLLVSRSDYNGLIEEYLPRLNQATNWKEVPPFLATAAGEFLRGSGLTLNDDLLKDVLREAAEIEQTKGIIRPVTINLCGLVLGRFSGGLPRGFRPGGLIRGFLLESVTLPSIRDVAPRLVPHLITGYVTKRPRTVAELAHEAALDPAEVRGCLRVLGQDERGIVRPLDTDQQTWEISHDFLVPLLDSIVSRWTVSTWLRARPWLPWVAAVCVGLALVVAPSVSKDPIAELTGMGWTMRHLDNRMELTLDNGDPPTGSPEALARISGPISVVLMNLAGDVPQWANLNNLTQITIQGPNVRDLSPLNHLKNLTSLAIYGPNLTDVSPLKDLKHLSSLTLTGPDVNDASPLRALTNLTSLSLSVADVNYALPLKELRNLTSLTLRGPNVSDLSPIEGLTNLTSLTLSGTKVSDVSPLKALQNLTSLDLSGTNAGDVSPLKDLKKLAYLSLSGPNVSDVSPIKDLKNLTGLTLGGPNLTDVSALKELKNLTMLNLGGPNVGDLTPLGGLENLGSLNLAGTNVSDLSPLNNLTNLNSLSLSGTKVSDVSPLKGLRNLVQLNLNDTRVSDVSPLKDLTKLQQLYLSGTSVSDVSPLKGIKGLYILR